jgi:hypothetical protein
VNETGLPNGCQVEQAFILHRHAARYPSSTSDLLAINQVTTYLLSFGRTFTGPMSFFNTWSNRFGGDLLLPVGTYMEFQSGVNFWQNYGRILYNAPAGQNYYNPVGQSKPLIRANTIQRVIDSSVAWADGFFTLYNQSSDYNLLIIPATPYFNNTLSSYYSCKNFLNSTAFGGTNTNAALYDPLSYPNNYLANAVVRLSQYMPAGVNLTAYDVFILQQTCAYEYSEFGSSDFCNLFTLDEWMGFSYTYDIWFYNGYSYGSPTGRALGLGILQELLARLQNQTIPVSNSSVNSTYDGNLNTFPVNQSFYADFSHDFMIVGFLTALSLDYFRGELSSDPSAYPGAPNRPFQTTHIVPYAARVITEKIGCNSANPVATNSTATQYTPTQYGYSPSTATNKFIRMRLNNGILPLNYIRGGLCSGRTDGLCSLGNFISSQSNASGEANYQQVCFGKFTYNPSNFNDDGTYFA